MDEVCSDNRFELIEKYKKKLIEGTNIETSPDEMKVLDNILFRMWQMKWLENLDKIYIRFGLIPEDERSNKGNGCSGDGYEVIGKEIGVSVWNTIKINNKYHLVAPHSTRFTYGDFSQAAFPDNCCGVNKREKIYVVKGREVGFGSDNEPLLRDIEIVEELPYNYFGRDDED